MKKLTVLLLTILFVSLFAQEVKMTVTSNAFKDGELIPVEYTGYGEDKSPDLIINDLPKDTKTLAIIMDDLDVPFTSEYNHWIIFNIPVLNYIPSGIPGGGRIDAPFTATQGVGYGKNIYRGPKPPAFMKKPHRYVFTVYALSDEVNLTEKANKKDLLKAMEGKILSEAKITGLYGNK